MKKLLTILNRIVPAYAWLPIVAALAVNQLAFIGCRMINMNRYHYDLTIPLDAKVPFLTWFSVIYLLAFAQWAAGYVLIGRESREFCRKYFAAEITAKILCGICFLILPTMNIRPDVPGNTIFDLMLKMVYSVDKADNLFPSIHCLESWICFRAACQMKKTPRWYMWGSLVMTLLVFTSTVCLRQHVLVDIPGGVLFAEAGFLIYRKCGIDQLLHRGMDWMEDRKWLPANK